MPRKPVKSFGLLRKPLHKVLQPKKNSQKSGEDEEPTKLSGHIIKISGRRQKRPHTAEAEKATVFRRVFVSSSRKRTSSGNKVSERSDERVSLREKGTQNFKPGEQLRQKNSWEHEAVTNRDFETQPPSVHFNHDWEGRVKVLTHGDMLVALNCIMPRLELVPSVADPRKPLLDPNFSLFSDSSETLRNVVDLAKRYNEERKTRRNAEVSLFIKERSQLSAISEKIIALELEIEYPEDVNNNKVNHQRDLRRCKSLDAFSRSKKPDDADKVQSKERIRTNFVSYREALMQSCDRPVRRDVVTISGNQPSAKETRDDPNEKDTRTSAARTPRSVDILDENIFRENHDLYKMNVLRKHLPERYTEMDQMDSASQTLYDCSCIVKEKTNLIWALPESSGKSKSSYSAIVRRKSSENVTPKSSPHSLVKIVRPTKSPESESNFTVLNNLSGQRSWRLVEKRRVHSAPASESSAPATESSPPAAEKDKGVVTELERTSSEREENVYGEKINDGFESTSDSLKECSKRNGISLYPNLDKTLPPNDPPAQVAQMRTTNRSQHQRAQYEPLQQQQRSHQYFNQPLLNMPRQQYCPACHPAQYLRRPQYQTSFPCAVFPWATANPVALQPQIAALRHLDPRVYRNSCTAMMNLYNSTSIGIGDHRLFNQLNNSRFSSPTVLNNQAGISVPRGTYRMTTVSELERQILEQSRAYEENNIRLHYERLEREGEEQYPGNDSNGNGSGEIERASYANRFPDSGSSSYPQNQTSYSFKRFF